MKKKVLKATVATVLGAMLLSPGISFATEKTVYDLKKGKLVQKKTGKVVKGYAVYKGKLYKNGKSNKGYARVGTGASMKLYFNTALKKGYKTADHKKYLFKDGKLVKGYKQAAQNERLYKNGMLKSGYEVYQNQKGTQFLYFNGTLKKGLKTATRNNQTTLFKDGVVSQGNEVFKGKLYTDGQLNKAFTQVGDLFYNNGFLATGVINGVEYANGVVVPLEEDIAYKDAKLALEKSSEQVNLLTKEYEELLKVEGLINGEKASTSSVVALSTNQSEINQFIQELKAKDLSKLTAEEKSELAAKIKAYKQKTTEKLQVAVAEYFSAIEKVTVTSKALLMKDPTKQEDVQETIEFLKNAVTTLQENTKVVQDLKIESSKLEAILKKITEVIQNPPTENEGGEDTEETKPPGNNGADPKPETPPGNNGTDPKPETPPGNNGADPKPETPPGNNGTDPKPETPPGNNGTDPKPETPPGNNGTDPKPETPSNPEGSEEDSENGAIEDINKPLSEIVKLIQFNLNGELAETGDKVIIEGETYIVNDQGSTLQGPTKYITKSDMQKLIDAHKVALTTLENSLATENELISVKSQLNRRIGFFKESATNIQLSELQAIKRSFYQTSIVTNETNEINLKAILEDKVNQTLPEGIQVKVEKIHSSNGKYYANYTVTKGDVVAKSFSSLEFLLNTPEEHNEKLATLRKQYEEIKESYHIERDENNNPISVSMNGETYQIVEEPATHEKGKYVKATVLNNIDHALKKFEEGPSDLKELEAKMVSLKLTIQFSLVEGWTSIEREELKNIPGLADLYIVHESKSDLKENYEEMLQLAYAGLLKLIPEGATLSIVERENNGSYYVDAVEVTYTITKDDVSYSSTKLIDAISSGEEAIKRQEALVKLGKLEQRFKLPTDTEKQFSLDDQLYTVLENEADLNDGIEYYIYRETLNNLESQYKHVMASVDDETMLAGTLKKLVTELENTLTNIRNSN